MYIVRHLTYSPTNWTEAKDLFSEINKSSLWIFIHNGTIKNILLYIYLNNYLDETLAVTEVLEYLLKHNTLKVSIKDTRKNRLKRYFNTQFPRF